MLILIADFGDDVPEQLVGSFKTQAEAMAKIAELDDSTDPAESLDGADIIIVDTKSGHRWMLEYDGDEEVWTQVHD